MLIAALVATAAGLGGALALMSGWFALGGALLLGSVLVLRWPRSIWSAPLPADLPPRTRRLALLAVCAVAVFFRFYHLNQPGLWGDDATNGLLAFDILDGKIHSPTKIVQHSHSNFHALSNYPIAAAFWLFGPDITSLRLPGVVMGSLCVPLLYGTVAPLFGDAVALLGALFYATAAPQIIHAKELVQIITGQFFQLAGLCLLVRGLASRRAWMVGAAGLPLAACAYTYHSARLAPLVAGTYALAVLWSRSDGRRPGAAEQPGTRPARWGTGNYRPTRALAAALLVFAVALIPLIIGYVRDPEALVQRVGATSIWPDVMARRSLWPLWGSVWRTAMIFHYRQGPEFYWFGIATDPAVNVIVGFLFLHGAFESLARWREPRHLLLLAWFAVGVAPGLFSTEAPRIYRVFLGTPPIYVWAALPLLYLLGAPAAGWSRAAVRGVAVALIAVVPIVDFNYYFYRVYTHPSFRFFQGERIVEMARGLRAAGPGWTGYLLADTFNAEHETLAFLSRAWGLRIRDVASLADVLPLPELPEHGALFVLSHGALGAAAAIERMYPGQQLIEHRDPPPRTWWFDAWWPLAPAEGDDEVRVAFYPVPRAVAEHPQREPPWGLQGEFNIHGHHQMRHEPYPFYNFLPFTFPRRFDALWRGRLEVPEPGGYHVYIASNALSELLLDGRPFTVNDRVDTGEHDFTLRMTDVPPQLRLTIVWHRDGTTRELIPPGAFAPPAAAPNPP